MPKVDAGNGVRAEPIRLPGRGNVDWAAKCWVGGRHIATVSEPGKCSREAAVESARRWAEEFKEGLI